MDELIDILDSKGNATGEVCLKSEAHNKGLWHASIHAWIFTKNGQVLIQKRIENKDTFPGLWDVSVAGHIGAGEDPLLAARREIFEEVGFEIPPDSLNFIGTHSTDTERSKDLIDREYHHTYIVELTVPFENLRIQIEEVSEIKLIPIDELLNSFLNTSSLSEYVPYSNEYLKIVFDAINIELSKK